MWFSRQEYWSGLSCPPPGDFSIPGVEPRSPSLQADSLPSEPSGKPKDAGEGSLSLLPENFHTQESNRNLLHCRWVLLPVELLRKPSILLRPPWSPGQVKPHHPLADSPHKEMSLGGAFAEFIISKYPRGSDPRFNMRLAQRCQFLLGEYILILFPPRFLLIVLKPNYFQKGKGFFGSCLTHAAYIFIIPSSFWSSSACRHVYIAEGVSNWYNFVWSFLKFTECYCVPYPVLRADSHLRVSLDLHNHYVGYLISLAF